MNRRIIYTDLAHIRSIMSAAREGELEYLERYCRAVPAEKWSPLIVQFLAEFRRPNHRPKSTPARYRRFYSDPNKVAAQQAAGFVRQVRDEHSRPLPDGGKRRPYKIQGGTGCKGELHGSAIDWATALFNRSKAAKMIGRANAVKVLDLLQKGRTKPE